MHSTHTRLKVFGDASLVTVTQDVEHTADFDNYNSVFHFSAGTGYDFGPNGLQAV
jgi:hypothetical protein